MKRKLVLALFLLVGTLSFGQLQTLDTPDCQIGLDSDGSSGLLNSNDIDNRASVCTSWTLVYSSTGFSAVSIEFQSAPDSGGAPGAYVTWANIDSGSSLPLTSTNGGQVMGFRFQPHARIHINSTTGTGRIMARLLGYKPFKGATDPTNGSTNVNVTNTTLNTQGAVASGTSAAGVNPVLIAGINGGNALQMAVQSGGELAVGRGAVFSTGNPTSSIHGPNATDSALGVFLYNYNGASIDPNFYCPNTTKLNALAAATTQIVAGVAAKKVRVCSIIISNNNATATTLKMVEGTGASCGTGQTDVTGLWNIGGTSTAPVVMTFGATGALTTTTNADALCFTSSAASSLEITISFAQW